MNNRSIITGLIKRAEEKTEGYTMQAELLFKVLMKLSRRGTEEQMKACRTMYESIRREEIYYEGLLTGYRVARSLVKGRS